MADSTNDASVAEEDRLPWLEAVEDEDDDQAIAPAKLVGGVIAALAAIGLVIGGAFWVRDRNAAANAGGAPGVIAAAPGAYKVKPGEPGGMAVPGQGDTAYAASEGADPHSAIDLSALPEAPVTKTKAAPAPAPVVPAKPVETAKAPEPAKAPVETAKAPAKAANSGFVQLGAFSSEAKADAAWTALSKRFAFLAPLGKNITSATVGSGKVYRLRAIAGAEASRVCGKLKVAGESCLLVSS